MRQENVDNYSAYFIFLFTFLSLSDGFHPLTENPAADDDMVGNEVVWGLTKKPPSSFSSI